MLPTIAFEGTLTKDPALRFTAGGIAVATLSVAVNDSKRDDDGKWVKGETTFLNCHVWRKTAENAAESLHKGDNVVVTGRYRSRPWEDAEGNKRTAQEVDVDCIGLSLRFESIDGKPHAATKAEDDPWATNVPF